MPYKDREIEKIYWPISEVAEMLGVNTSQIRYWENEFDILRPSKNQKGDRSFTKRDVEIIKMIYHLVKEKGYTLEGARRAIKENRKRIDSEMSMRESLLQIRKFLTGLKESL